MADEYLMQLPYRVLTVEERDSACSSARLLIEKHDSNYAIEKVWKSTRHEALRVIDRIRSLGYKVSDPSLCYAGAPLDDGAEERSEILSSFTGQPIGRISLWEEWGFSGQPITVSFNYEENIVQEAEEAIKLAHVLKQGKMPFRLYPEKETLEKSLRRLSALHNKVEKILPFYDTYRM